MAEYPETVREFRAWFPDDAACRAYWNVVRWAIGRAVRAALLPGFGLLSFKPPFYRCAGCGYDFTVIRKGGGNVGRT